MNAMERIILADEIKRNTCHADIDVTDKYVSMTYLHNKKTLEIKLESEKVLCSTKDGSVDQLNYTLGWKDQLIDIIKGFME